MNFEKQKIYDELSTILTDWEEKKLNSNDLYKMLVKIQNNWEIIITTELE